MGTDESSREIELDVNNLTDEDKLELTKEVRGERKVHKALQTVEGLLTPAGGILGALTYMPIAPLEYAYYIAGKRGIASVQQNARTKQWSLEVEGKNFWFEDEPLGDKELLFNLPDYKLVKDWVNGKVKSKDINELFAEMKQYFKFFLDLSEEGYYDLLCYSVLQSWLIHWLNSVFYLSIMGQFGGGKTRIGESWVKLCRHGHLISNPSLAFVGRAIDKLKITPFFDEFDVIVGGREDNELYALVRSSQRKGQKYCRISEGGKPQMFNTYTSMGFSIHGDIEDALKSRSFIINTQETDKVDIPIVAHVAHTVERNLYSQLFIWYMDNSQDINNKYNNNVEHVEHVDYSGRTDIDLARKKVANEMLSHSPPEIVNMLNTLNILGRNIELLFIMGQLISLPSIQNINFDNIKSIINIKKEIMAEVKETGVLGALRHYMIKTYNKLKKDLGYRTLSGEFMISNKELYEGFTQYLRDSQYQRISPKNFLGLLRELGFNPNNRKNMRIKLRGEEEKKPRLACIFDTRVQRNLGVTIEPMTDERTFQDYMDEGIQDVILKEDEEEPKDL